MPFTEDELQSFNTMLEQRLQAHQRDMERALDQSMNEYRRELDQRLATVHSDVQRGVSQKLSDFKVRLETILSEKLNAQPARIIQTFDRDIEQRQQQIEGNIDRMLAAHLLGIEQLITHYSSRNDSGDAVISANVPAQLDTIEVQTELSWEDLMDIIGRALDDRLSVLNDAIQRSLKHLEQIIESMQVVMTSNHALLSNRLYHHQQLSFERAHKANDHARPISNGVNKPLTITEERVTNGVEPGGIAGQAQMEE